MLLLSKLFFILILINQACFEESRLSVPSLQADSQQSSGSSPSTQTSPTSVSSTSPTSPSSSTETISYQIVKETGPNKFKVQLILGGDSYTPSEKFCHIRKSTKNGDNLEFAKIDDCPENKNTSDPKNECIRACSGEDIKLEYNKFSPRTSYVHVVIKTSATEPNTAEDEKSGRVFALLVNPQFFVSTEAESGKLKLATKTCTPVACPIYYKSMNYEAGTPAADCDTQTTAANSVAFDLLIPHYEVRCTHYPSFFYNMPNEYMKKAIDIYQPQFYLTKKSDDEKQITVKFTNAHSHEICIFKVKDAAAAANDVAFESNCGNNDGECYAPCKNVSLNVSAAKSVYTILIQTRHHDLEKKEGNTYDGFKQNKYAITETGVGLLSEFTKVGVTFDSSFFKVGSDGTPTFTHYLADKPKSTGTATTTTTTTSKCPDGSNLTNDQGGSCKKEEAKLAVTGLEAGKPYIIEVASLGISDPTQFKEKIFIRTTINDDKSYVSTVPITTTSDISLKAVEGNVGTEKSEEPTCEYYISLAGKDYYYPAECEDSNPCRGWCKDTKKIVDLEPGVQYDIKVIAHKDYAEHIYSAVQMKLATLNVTYKFNLEGFEVNAELSTDTPASCQYEVQVKMKDEFERVLMCPSPPSPPSTPQVSDPQSATEPAPSEVLPKPKSPEVSPVSDTPSNVAEPSSQPSQKTKESNLESSKVARTGGIANDAPENAKNTNTNISGCLEMPMCSSIVFTTDYRARYPYKVIVTALGKSSEATIEIPSNKIKGNPTDVQKVLDVSITRDGITLTIETAHSTKITGDSKCKWELRNSSAKSNLMEQSCMSTTSQCESFPSCKSFDITGVPENNNYHLTVYLEADEDYFGVAEINQGEKNSAKPSNQMIIIVAAIVGAVVFTVIVGSVVMKK